MAMNRVEDIQRVNVLVEQGAPADLAELVVRGLLVEADVLPQAKQPTDKQTLRDLKGLLDTTRYSQPYLGRSPFRRISEYTANRQ
ncbi:MAG: hypothetical protein ABI758_01470 [Candidatus Woesebacteria bacterium]